MKGKEDSKCFPIGKTAQERGFSHVPECYKIPLPCRPNPNPDTADVPLIDLDGMNDPTRRHVIVKDIAGACRRNGFFQVVNHGISQAVLDEALSAAFRFFDLPTEEKVRYASSDVHSSIRYGTSLRGGVDELQFWRVFLKHYANPLKDWIGLWPNNPPDYREKMGNYAVQVQKLAVEIMGMITESLGLGPAYINKKLEEGVQVMAVNCYPPCPQPGLALGLPPHSDYSCLSIVLQSSPGLEILSMDDGRWKEVPHLHALLQVHVGDHLEVLSNGLYKSVVHRVTLNTEKARVSIASLHNLGMDEKMETAKELVDEQNPRGYRGSSFRDSLNFFSKNGIGQGRSFLETLKLRQ